MNKAKKETKIPTSQQENQQEEVFYAAAGRVYDITQQVYPGHSFMVMLMTLEHKSIEKTSKVD
ncbi:hypothetical protein E2C01_005318 [Portunus trituberculatus]|uniref:Uncharacterized protein n=1 Tax=Portunus trituberculatus TaxID=210409 RepID=A0A5B7CTR1_PORTR|nr:hypothetical protein [Portunus trituberculatus]